ncbi:hypothetical protein [Spiroplasma endosymbiont of Amphimallon solstitiale]|uniref:hypothetical protein n=1 Tax=Spiroplasma endosymbiont of Amphimallon solstitiale TaxID=3066288 RepID=UPI00313C7538
MKHLHLQLKRQQLLIKRCSYWKIFPFIINNGAISLTETGYKPINSKISDFGQYELILTGTTPVVCIWKNSTKIYQKNKGKIDPITHKPSGQDEFYTKQYKIGDYWNAYLIDDTSGVDFSNLPNNQIFKTVQTKRQYTLVMFEEHITIDDYLQFFVVFNDENENIGGNSGKNQDRQLLYISNVTNYYSPYNGAFSMQVLTFSSLNDRVVSTGQNTLDFVQYAIGGSGYAFPTIEKGKVTLNRTLVHRVFKNLEVIEANPIKVKLEKNQPIFVAIDDGHRKFWDFKRKGIKHSMRLITTYTDNINHKVQNKRVKAIIRPTRTVIGVKKTAEFIKEHCQKFYENVEQAKIIICGDSAGWIKDVADYLFNYVEKYGWPKIIHQFTLKILFLIKNLLKVTLFSVKIL